MQHLRRCVLLISTVFMVGCGISQYPGQPGVVTNGYSKIDFEDLGPDGLWVYETSYDNRPGAPGIGAIITKLYKGAQTNTSNVRTNSDGTLYRVKGPYDGGEIQMISIPRINQIILPAKSLVSVLYEYQQSLDELDDRNLAEEALFTPTTTPFKLFPRAMEFLKLRLQLLRLGRLSSRGTLTYELEAATIGEHKFTPAKPIVIESNLAQNGIRTSFSPLASIEFAQFLETHFPKGHKGNVLFHMKGSETAVTMRLGIHTMTTAKNSGINIIPNASPELIEQMVTAYKN